MLKRMALGATGCGMLLAGIVMVSAPAQSAPALPGAYACPSGRLMLCIASMNPTQGQAGSLVHFRGRFGSNYRALQLKMYRNGRATDMQVQHWSQRNVTAIVPRHVL